MRILELGGYLAPAYAGMILAEQGHRVTKWANPGPDPLEQLHRGDELWAWVNHGKTVHRDRALEDVSTLTPGETDIIIDNVRAATWARLGVDPEVLASRLGVTWVSLRADDDGRSFDVIAQLRAWGDRGVLPFYLGDTAAGLWLAFKALAAPSGHHVIRQGACLAKLVEGELVAPVDPSEPWDEPGTYGPAGVLYRGEWVREQPRNDEWRRENLRHVDGRYQI